MVVDLSLLGYPSRRSVSSNCLERHRCPSSATTTNADDLETLLEHAVSLARSPDDVMERMCTTTSTELLREDQIEQPVKLSSVKGRHRNS